MDAKASSRQRQEHARNLRVLARLERNLQRPMRREIAGRASAAARGYSENGVQGTLRALNGHDEAILALLKRQYLAAAEVFGRQTLDKLKGVGAGESKDYQDDMFDQEIQEFLAQWGTGKIASDISGKTRGDILTAIQQGQAEGLSTTKISKLIREKAGKSVARLRSHIIARTETHNAAGFAQHAAAGASGVEVLKRWMTAGDDRVRDDPGNSHAEMNGETVGMDEPFDFGDYTLMHPGDRSGPAKGVIMCRCFVMYEPSEEAIEAMLV